MELKIRVRKIEIGVLFKEKSELVSMASQNLFHKQNFMSADQVLKFQTEARI